jgi:hypothetical protein
MAPFAVACAQGTPVGASDATPPTPSDAAPLPDATSADADAGVQTRGHVGGGSVAGGVKAQSPNFKLIGSAGKGDGTAASPNFKHRGGVIGGTQP